jgi:hypothetical protein
MKCNKCDLENELVSGKSICKICWSKDRKAYYQKNKEDIIKKQLENYHNDKSKAIKRYNDNKDKFSEKNAKYYLNNKETINRKKQERHRVRMIEEPLYKLTYNIRRNIKSSLKAHNYTKSSKTHQLLGCSFDEFKTHIESKFEPWMNWDNYGKYNGELNYGWDFDHIIPLSSAKSEKEMVGLLHFSNVQPLCSKINRDIKKANYL